MLLTNVIVLKKKYAKILETLDTKQLKDMINEDHGAELTCAFCGTSTHLMKMN